ncbi:Eukaryotic translation initiation factor 4B [Frankliniella fusca]|uniref:Eukaryotic translation initiation factor 4B n=1 Tax=Frankliniella fusca TaxID=407009 RepID=A0AAE1HFJ6_9NEOP|nr:Eukaryotic translation initiation factor 4B [Frankliniella fusca]
MAASGQKNKKNKWKKVELTTVLAETRPVTAWADEVEIDERELALAAQRKSALPTAPRSARGSDDERVPNAPPYVAYITNIPFEVIEEDFVEFFGDLQIENIRLPKNDATGKLKGYGYVEFTERQGLIEALQIPDTSMKGRRIRIDVSENNDRDRGYGRSDRMGRDRMGMGMEREYDPERTAGDWRSAPRMEPEGDRRPGGGRSGYGSGGFGDREGRDRDGGGFGAPRETEIREGGWREGMGSGTGGGGGGGGGGGSDRFGGDSYRRYDDRDRRGGGGFDSDRGGRWGSDRDRDGGDRYGDRPRYGDRDGDRPRFGGDRDRDGDRPRYGGDRDRDGGDRYGGDRPRYGDREREEDRERFGRREDGPPSESSGEPKERPRLNLAPRTKPIENPLPPPPEVKEEKKPADPPAQPAPPVPRASIFGAAKPVDTTAREREIEERLNRERERAPRRDDRDRSADNSKSKEGSDHGDEPKKVEPAPPPKENAWSRRPRIEPSADNGNDSSERATSPGSLDNKDRPSSPDRSRQTSQQDDEKGEFRDRSNRSKSRDQKDGEFIRGREDGNNSERYGRKGGRGSSRLGPQGPSRGMGQGKVERGSGGGIRGKHLPDRPSRRDHSNEDKPRLPKYEEKPLPNFVASNKYAFLNEDDDGPEETAD